MQTKRMNSPSQLTNASEKRLTLAERDLLLRRLAADERISLRYRLAAKGKLLQLRLAAGREHRDRYSDQQPGLSPKGGKN